MTVSISDVFSGVWAAGSTLVGATNIAMKSKPNQNERAFTDPNRKDIHEHAVRTKDPFLRSVNHYLNQKGVVLHDEPHRAIKDLSNAKSLEELAEGHAKVAKAFSKTFQEHRDDKHNEYNLAGYGLHHTAAVGFKWMHHHEVLTDQGHHFG